MAPLTNIGNAGVAFGTVELGDLFGQVETGSLERMIEEIPVPDGFGGYQAVLLANPGFQLQFTAIFPADGELPPDGTPITFPRVGVVGNSTNWALNWASKECVKISVTAKQWASIGSNPPVGTLTPP